MAGMGDALGLIFAGAADNAAGNRASDIRDQEKAGIAAAREQQLAKFRSDLDLRNQQQKQGHESAENEKDRSSRKELNDADNSAAMARTQVSESGATARASMAQRGEDARLDKRINSENGVDGKTGKRLQGTPQIEKNEDGSPTGRLIYNFRDGSAEVRSVKDLPGGDTPTKAEGEENEAKATKYAQDRIGELSSFFSSDKENFKDYGGSKAKALEYFKDEYRSGKAADTGEASAPSRPAAADMDDRSKPAKENTGMSAEAKYIFDQVKAVNPDADDGQILQTLSADPRYAKYFSPQ